MGKMQRSVAVLSAFLAFTSVARADSKVTDLTAAGALSGSEIFYCVQNAADRKCTATQLATYINSGYGAGVTTALGLATNANYPRTISISYLNFG